jgi:hypothetical protein
MPKFLDVTDKTAAQAALGINLAATGVANTDQANIASAFNQSSVVRAESGTYAVSNNNISINIPAGKSLILGNGSALRLSNNVYNTWASGDVKTIVNMATGSKFFGSLDGNRHNQNKTQYNAAATADQATGITAYGTAEAKLSDIHIDANISRVVNNPVNFRYVTDSYIRVRATDCGGPLYFSDCDNIEVDIEVDGTDNAGWKVWQHGVDFVGCTNVRGRVVIRNQKADTSGMSAWMSGLTMIDCNNVTFELVDAETAEDVGSIPGVGASLIPVSNLVFNRFRAAGYSDVGLELGGVSNAEFNNIDIDGRYTAGNPSNPGTGINIYNNAYTRSFTRSREYCQGITFNSGTIQRCLGNGIWMMAAQDTKWVNVSVIGCRSGLITQTYVGVLGSMPTDGVALSTTDISNHRFLGCSFNFNENHGTQLFEGQNLRFIDCAFRNNGQGKAYGTTRSGAAASSAPQGFVTGSGSDKPSLTLINCDASDTQSTANGFPNAVTSNRIAVSMVGQFSVGQTITLTGAGSGGIDLKTRINDIVRDELVLQNAVSVNDITPVTLTGTIAVTGTTVTGSGTSFLTNFTARAYIKVGTQYRRVVRVASDTSATLESAFTSNVAAGTELKIIRVPIVAAATQNRGYYLDPTAKSPVLVGCTASGNTLAQVVDLTDAATKLIQFPYSSIAVMDNSAVTFPDLTDPSKKLKLTTSSIGTATTRTYTMPAVSSTISTIDVAETVTGAKTFTGNPLTVGADAQSQELILNGASGQGKIVRLKTAGSNRWSIRSNSTAESGTADGSDFQITAFNNSGTYINDWLTISRSTGNITLQGQSVTIGGNPLGLKVSVPGTSSTAGLPGQWAVGGGYVYYYTGNGSTHSWVRAAAASW